VKTLKIFTNMHGLLDAMNKDFLRLSDNEENVTISKATRIITTDSEETHYKLSASLNSTSYLGSSFNKIEGIQNLTGIRTIQQISALLRKI